jgi:hypothetical protein
MVATSLKEGHSGDVAGLRGGNYQDQPGLSFSAGFSTHRTRTCIPPEDRTSSMQGALGRIYLRIKVFSERMGFSVRFKTRRCPHIPTDTDMCPGRMSTCEFIQRPGRLPQNGRQHLLRAFSKSRRLILARPLLFSTNAP